MTDNQPAWLKADRAKSAAAAQLIRARTATLDDDTLFWIEFDSSGPRAFNRILARKVGDGATFEVQLSWKSMDDSPIADISWRAVAQPYPPSNCNPTMRLVEMEPELQTQLAMLLVHDVQDAVRRLCRDTHDNALLCRAQAERAGLT